MNEQIKNTSKWFKTNVKCCYNCQNWYRGEWLDDPLGDYTKCDEEWRHPDCPLVPVPTPHGPLIDADEIIEVQMLYEMYDEWTLKTMSVAEYLAFAADMPPTIIEAEEGRQE